MPTTYSHYRFGKEVYKKLTPAQKAIIDPWTEETGIKPWNAWRVALVGAGQGPDMYELSAFLGKEEVMKRMKFAIETLG